MRKMINEINRNRHIGIEAIDSIEVDEDSIDIFGGWGWGGSISSRFSMPGFTNPLESTKPSSDAAATANENDVFEKLGHFFRTVKQKVSEKREIIVSRIHQKWMHKKEQYRERGTSNAKGRRSRPRSTPKGSKNINIKRRNKL